MDSSAWEVDLREDDPSPTSMLQSFPAQSSTTTVTATVVAVPVIHPEVAVNHGTSEVWKHFTPGTTNNVCKHCGTKIKTQTDSSTSNMRGHMKDIHGTKLESGKTTGVPVKAIDRGALMSYFAAVPSSSSSSPSGPTPPTSQKRKRYVLMLLRLAAEMNASFRSIAESAVLGEFMMEELGFAMPSRMALSRLLPQYYVHLVADLKQRLSTAESVSVTTDSTFLTLHQTPYICITGHWIDAHWQLRHCVLAVFEASQQETGDWIAERLRVVLEDQLCLSSKLHCIVTDEGKNFLSAVQTLTDMEVLRESLRCACHRIQLTVKRALMSPECALLMSALKKAQTIVLQFKNGWMSRKRDVLKKFQDQYVAELREDVAKLNAGIVLHTTREKREQAHKKEQLLRAAEADLELQKEEGAAQGRERAQVEEEVRQLSLAGEHADMEGDDDDDDPAQSSEEKGPDAVDNPNIVDLADEKEELMAVIGHITRKRALIAVAATRWLTWVEVAERTMMWRGPLMKALDEIAKDTSFRKKKRNEDIPASIASMRISDEDAVILTQFRQLGANVNRLLKTLEGDDNSTIGRLLYVRSELLAYFERGAAAVGALDPVITAFCKKAGENCLIKFNTSIDRPALIGAALDPRHHRLTFLSRTDQILCFDALMSAYTALKIERDDNSPVKEPVAKRARKSEVPEFDFNSSQKTKSTIATDEPTRFAALPDQDEDIDPLVWWSMHSSMFPILSILARRYLAIPASSASSERLFSQLKLTATPARRNMSPDTLCMLLFVEAHHKWYRGVL